MRLSATNFADVLGAYNILIHWGRPEYREDIPTRRREAYENLLDGLRHLEPRTVNLKSMRELSRARALVEKARALYQFDGNIDGSMEFLEQSREKFLGVELKPGAASSGERTV